MRTGRHSISNYQPKLTSGRSTGADGLILRSNPPTTSATGIVRRPSKVTPITLSHDRLLCSPRRRFRISFDAEAVNRRFAKRLARPKNRVWELRLIRRIREMLRFQAERAVLDIGAAIAVDGTVEKVAGIQLHATLRGLNFHDASAGGIFDSRGVAEFAGGAKHIVVVVSHS